MKKIIVAYTTDWDTYFYIDTGPQPQSAMRVKDVFSNDEPNENWEYAFYKSLPLSEFSFIKIQQNSLFTDIENACIRIKYSWTQT